MLLYSLGWGRMVGGGKGANILQQAMLPVANDKRCQSVNGRLGRVYSDTMICAGGQGRGGCQVQGTLMPCQRKRLNHCQYG